MSTSTTNNSKPVLVIGGGTAGVSFITGLRKLDKDAAIILVEPKDFCELIWACYRSPFDDQVAADSLVPLGTFCHEKKVKHMRTTVARLTKDQAELEDGTVVDFAAAVVTVGAKMTKWANAGNGLPNGYNGSREERLERLKNYGQELLNAKRVVIIGGGLVGVELAGDVAGYGKLEQNEVNVTLVHSKDRLMTEFSQGAAAMAKGKLEKLGVKVILNEKGMEQDGKVILQNSKEELEADKIVSVVGLSSNNSFVQIEDASNETGFLKTDKFGRVNGCDKVFAYGDCAQELRNAAYLIMQNGPTMGHNVKVVLDNGTNLKELDKGMTGGMVTIGPYDGVAQLPFTYTQYLLPRFKNYTMMFNTSKPLMGVK